MKIGIVTYYGVHNHGAVLQANALETVMERMGNTVEFLTFERNYDYISKDQAKKYKIGLSSIPFYIRYLAEKGPGNILFNVSKNKILENYRKEKFKIGSTYENFDGDMVVIGSDEVFSLEIGVNPFMYGYGYKCKEVSSYAGCFGPTTANDIKEKKLEDLIKNGLKSMRCIGVRDQNSYDVVKKIAGIDAKIVCDPVILYGYQSEMREFSPSLQDYLIIYSYDKNMNNLEEINKIKHYARENGLQIISVGYYHKWCKNINATPNELLGWIKNASLIVTDTFHGTVMSIICNTPMVVKLRGNKNKLQFLLSEYGLNNRTLIDFSEIEDVAKRPIDFNAVNQKIEERRHFSMEFLNTLISRDK